jgi:hypothetical protein
MKYKPFSIRATDPDFEIRIMLKRISRRQIFWSSAGGLAFFAGANIFSSKSELSFPGNS